MYEIFERLLRANGVTVADVAKATGINASTLANWKRRNNLLSAKTAKKIADYFGVSVDYIMTGDESKNSDGHYYLDENTRETAEEIRTNKELKLLFDAARDASPEDLITAHQLLLALKRKERHDD